MTLRAGLCLLLAGLTFWGRLGPSAHAQEEASLKRRLKKRVAVLPFSDQTESNWRWWDRRPLAEGLTDLVREEVEKSDRLVLVNVPEPADTAVAPETPTLSRLWMPDSVEVELGLSGVVLHFESRLSHPAGRLKGYLPTSRRHAVRVTVQGIVFDGHAGVVLQEERLQSEKSAGLAVGRREPRSATPESFYESLLGKATRDVIEDLVELVERVAEGVPWETTVAAVGPEGITLSGGGRCGLRPGDRLRVYRRGREIRDPETGLSLGSIDTEIATVEVTVVAEDSVRVYGKLVQGAGVRPGDVVRVE